MLDRYTVEMLHVWETYLQQRFKEAATLYSDVVQKHYATDLNRALAYKRLLQSLGSMLAFPDLCKADPFAHRAKVVQSLTAEAQTALQSRAEPELSLPEAEAFVQAIRTGKLSTGMAATARYQLMCGLAGLQFYELAFECLDELLRISNDLPLADRYEVARLLSSQRHFACGGNVINDVPWQKRDAKWRAQDRLQRSFGLKYALAFAGWLTEQSLTKPGSMFATFATAWKVNALDAALRIFDYHVLDNNLGDTQESFQMVLTIAETLPDQVLNRFRRSAGRNCIYTWGTVLDPTDPSLSSTQRKILSTYHGRLEELINSLNRSSAPHGSDAASGFVPGTGAGTITDVLSANYKISLESVQEMLSEHVQSNCPAVSLIPELSISVECIIDMNTVRGKFQFIYAPHEFTEIFTEELIHRLIDVINDFELTLKAPSREFCRLGFTLSFRQATVVDVE